MNRKNIYIGIALAALIAASVYGVTVKKPENVPLKITWLPTSALPTNWENARDFTWFSMQNNTIYCMGNPIPEVDVSTFVVSSLGDYGKDESHVYWCSQEVGTADPATFTVLNKEYSKDASHVFYDGYYLLSEADPATFSVVPSPGSPDGMQTGYGKDKTYVYNLYRKLPDADPATFVLSPVPRDKNWVYQGSDVVGPASLITNNA